MTNALRPVVGLVTIGQSPRLGRVGRLHQGPGLPALEEAA